MVTQGREGGKQAPRADSPVVFFCLRADSDVDHIVPVIDALARQRRHQIRVIVYDPIKTYKDDYRIRHLRQCHGIATEHLLELPGIPPGQRAMSSVLRSLFHGLLALQRRSPLNSLSRLLRLVLTKLNRRLKDISETDQTAEALAAEIGRYSEGLVIFDHTINPLAAAATAAARRHGLSTLSLPHSVPHLSDLPRDAVVAEETEDSLDWGALYDKVALPNAATADRFARDCRETNLLTTLGSARFSRSWGETLDGISPRFDWNPGGTKVLFILSKKGPYVDWDEVNRVSARLCGDKRLAIAFKPHPRTEISGLPSISAGGRVTIASSDLPTASLVQWADLVVFWGSSVIYDAIRLRKPVLHLAYLFRLHFDFEPYMKSWRVDGYEDFCTRLDHFIETGGATYSEAEAQACMNALVESNDRPALNANLQLLDELLHGRPSDLSNERVATSPSASNL